MNNWLAFLIINLFISPDENMLKLMIYSFKIIRYIIYFFCCLITNFCLQDVISVVELSFNSNTVKLFPNPTTDKVRILNESKIKINTAMLLDSSGKLIKNLILNLNENSF